MNLVAALFSSLQKLLGGPKILALLMLVLPFFMRERLYNSWCSYQIEQTRDVELTLDSALYPYIRKHREVYDRHFRSMNDVILVSLKITTDYLNHDSALPNQNTPLSMARLGAANSSDLAAFCASICNFLIKENRLDQNYNCQTYVASRLSGGKNVSALYRTPIGGKSPFAAEREIVAIAHKQNGETYFIDPTLYEQSSIVHIKVSGYPVITEGFNEPAKSILKSRSSVDFR